MRDDDDAGEAGVATNTSSRSVSSRVGVLGAETRHFLDHILGAVVVTDLRGCILEFNAASERLFGFQRTEVVGLTVDECLVPQELKQQHRLALQSFVDREAELSLPFSKIFHTVQTVGKECQPIEVDIKLELMKFGGCFCFVVSFHDITILRQFSASLVDTLLSAELSHHQKAKELESVHRSERKAVAALQTQQLITDLLQLSMERNSLSVQLQLALERIARLDCFAAADFTGAIFLQAEPERQLQMVASVPVGLSPDFLSCRHIPESHCACFQEGMPIGLPQALFPSDAHDSQATAESVQPAHLCIPLQMESGSVGVLHLLMTLKQYSYDELDPLLDGIAGSLANIIWRSRMDEALHAAIEKAESANKAKSEFLANMSHEIRSPLNAIIGLTDLMVHSEVSINDMQENLAIINASSLSLQDLINGILDLSKIEAGHFMLECAPFDLIRLLDDVCNLMAVKAHQKGLELYCRVDRELSPFLQGDGLRLKQVLINLINNAIKFTQTGEVVLEVKATPSDSEKESVWLRFSVTDTGIGVSHVAQNKIFENFIQADGSVARKYGGTGLGLTISRHLVRLMGGQLSLSSQPGQGSCFYFTLPFSAEQRTESLEQVRGLQRRRQWDAVGQTMLSGARILIADSHATGRTILEEILTGFGAQVVLVTELPALLNKLGKSQGEPFAWVIIDEVILQQGELPIEGSTGCSVSSVLLLLSSHASASKLDPSGFFSSPLVAKKPVSAAKLLRIFSKSGSAASYDEQSCRPQLLRRQDSQRSLRVLLVDDLSENQKLASSILQKLGHRVQTADNGLLALEALQSASFDLILMDLQMPEMDGFETTRRIRGGTLEEVGNPQIPIIAVTAMGMMNEQARCVALGMNGFLLKPYRMQQLVDAVAPFCKPQAVVTAVPLTPQEMDQEVLIRLQGQFIREAKGRLEQLQKGLGREDPGGVMREIHWFRDIAVHIGASRVNAQAIRLIGQIEMGEWESAATISNNLAQQVDNVILLLDNKEPMQ
ncbi:MAG: response regulator [Magnetococcales bacterium]|nr:response regulator [Magnetococcales bacterium]MBF0116016.1 response regulator [Magnetococcales bacterium]